MTITAEEKKKMTKTELFKYIDKTRKSNIRIFFRLDSKDNEKLNKQIKDLNLKTKTDYFRSLINKDFIYKGLLKNIIYEYKKIGININQIAKQLNKNRFEKIDTTDFLIILKRVENNTTDILKMLQKLNDDKTKKEITNDNQTI